MSLEGAVEMIRFAIELCELQHTSGRHFICEKPQSSRAWSLNEVVKLAYHEGVEKATFHQCMYGLEARDKHGVAPAYKPTSVLTNHSALAEVLQKRCDGNHRHAQLVGKGACTQAARYPPGLCAAVVKGVQVVKRHREMVLEARDRLPRGPASANGVGPRADSLGSCEEDILYELELEDMCEKDPSTWEDLATQKWQEYSQFSHEQVDSTTGEVLDPDKVQAGCAE